METATTLGRQTSPAGIISQQQFDEYAANWVAASSDPAGGELARSFQLPDSRQLLALVSFPILQIARLVSTVGVAHIKVRFLIKTDETTKQPHFTLALFATDALDARISSYYLADEYWKPASPHVAPLHNDEHAPIRRRDLSATPAKTEVPEVLARYWLRAWAAVKQATPALFATPYGPLRGYTFELNDFILPLRQVTRLSEGKLLVDFDLHEYYRAKSLSAASAKTSALTNEPAQNESQRTEPQDDELVKTFGLMLRLEASQEQAGDGAVYDISAPCPPTC